MKIRTTVAIAAALLGSACAVLAACSLGLDESLIDGSRDGSVAPDADEPGLDDAGETDGGPRPDPVSCTKDEDCTSSNGCLTGRCDLARKACAYDVCKPSACNVGTCNTSTKTCGDVKPYPLVASTFKVGEPASCGRCIAAVHPYVFVGTANGAVAWNVANPSAAPIPVTLGGLGFAPTLLIASGSRVYFFGAPIGGGPPSRVPLAWLDVPSDPFLTAFELEATLARWNRPSGEGTGALARGDDGALLYTGAGGLPAAVVPSPPKDPVDLLSYPTPMPPGGSLVSMSGTRFLTQAVDVNGNATFGFVPNVGTPEVSDAGLALAAPPEGTGLVGGGQWFSQANDGVVLWAYAQPNAPLPTPGVAVRAVRASFLVGSQAGPADGRSIDVEVYTPPPPVGTAVVGPIAAVDRDTALVVAASRENIANASSVHFVKRDPLALVNNADAQPRRVVLPIPVSTLVGATGSNGIGYVLANEAATADAGANASVYVLDPGCAP